MAIPQKASPPALPSCRGYEEDLVAWALDNAALLRAGRLSEIDALSLAEELEDLGKSERRALGSHLRVLVTHLLKWQCQPERRGASWRLSIRNSRAEIRTILADSPSLVREVEPLLAGTYELARDNASGETGLPEVAFPQVCPYAAEQCLSDDFWPA
jgi:hypothetical protein